MSIGFCLTEIVFYNNRAQFAVTPAGSHTAANSKLTGRGLMLVFAADGGR